MKVLVLHYTHSEGYPPTINAIHSISQQVEKDMYQFEIEKLIGHPIDFAFVPVDYRLKTFSRLAMDYFIEKLTPTYLIPMHFAEEYDTIQHLKTESKTKVLKSKFPNSYIF